MWCDIFLVQDEEEKKFREEQRLQDEAKERAIKEARKQMQQAEVDKVRRDGHQVEKLPRELSV